MADEILSPKSPASPTGHGLRRALTMDESAQFRRRPSARGLSSNLETPSPGITRRRSSNFSEYSLSEVRKQLQSSTDDLLVPKPSASRLDEHGSPSHWHSAPLAFALLPAIGGMLFQNGSAVVTDIMLLGLAAIFLNWSVRLPWDWYHSAQAIRVRDEENSDAFLDEESSDENYVDVSQTSLDDVPEDAPVPTPETKKKDKIHVHKQASHELYIHEILALFSCFLLPIIGAYLLHSIRGYLSRPSEGLVSDYNLTIFLLASELRPISHLAKLIQTRTLHLQRVVNANPYESANGENTAKVTELAQRLEDLEARALVEQMPVGSSSEPAMNGKQAAMVTTEVRRTLQPDLDALNRAVRRYEKRATLQTMQTESRLLDLEARLADAISLAAAAAQTGQRQRHSLWTMLVDWVASGVALPIQAFGALASLPFKSLVALIDFARAMFFGKARSERARKSANGKVPTHSRVGADRLQGRGLKR